MNETARRILRCLNRWRLRHANEDELQRAIAVAFESEGIEFEREEYIAGGRIDFRCGRVLVECKIKGTLQEVARQVQRYAIEEKPEAIIVATTCSGHRLLAGREISGVPIYVAYLGGL